MPNLPMAILIGLVAGVIASWLMELYQGLAAKPFGQKGSSDDSATVKLADNVKQATTGDRVTQKRRAASGRLVHYATGTVIGIVYAVAASHWPPITIGFGIVFGIAVALVLDDAIVPAVGIGPSPWQTPLNTHLYSLSSHLVFGAALEAVRRIGWQLLG